MINVTKPLADGTRGEHHKSTAASDVAPRHETSRESAGIIWDAHSGFMPHRKVELENLNRWRTAGVNHLSVNVGFDALGWQDALITIAAFRKWIGLNDERFAVVSSVGEILQAKEDGKMSITFDLEGANCLDGRIEMIGLFHTLGVRQMLLAYNLNNQAGGGCNDDDRGLLPFGRDVVDEMNRCGMFVDVSHCGYRTSMEVFDYSRKPVIFSHSNPKSLYKHYRNITDEQIKACASTKGIVGVTGVSWFMGGACSSESYADSICYIADLVGVEHVGIALDFAFDANSDTSTSIYREHARYWASPYVPAGPLNFVTPEQINDVSDILRARGMLDSEVSLVLGGNFLRLAHEIW